MRRTLALVAPALVLIACSRDAPVPTEPPGGDPYAPLPTAALDALVTELSRGGTDTGGTEAGPAPALDRPYVRYSDAVERARLAVRSTPDSRTRRVELARAYAKAGRYDLARAEYGHLLALEPRDAMLHLGYGRELWYERYAADDALLHLRAARALGLPRSESPELFFLLGDLAETKDDLGRAERFFKNVVERIPHHVEATYRIGALARTRGDDDLAFDKFRTVVRLDPGHVGGLFGLGQLLVQRGAAEEGEALLARHARLRRIDALGYADESEAYQCIVLGNHEALAGAFDRALAEFDRALELEPDNLDARSYRAATHLDTGHVDEALADWKRVLARDPDHVHATTALADFHLAPIADPRRDPAAALPLARRAVAATDRRDARSLALLARALARSGNRQEALAVVDEAIALDPDRGAWRALRNRLEADAEDDS